MGVDTRFFSQLLGWYAVMLCILSIQSALLQLPYITLFSFFMSITVSIASFAAKRVHHTSVLKVVIIGVSVFLFFIIFICTTYGVNQGFTNFWSFMACNIVIFTFGMIFGFCYSFILFVFYATYFWTPAGQILTRYTVLFIQQLQNTSGILAKQQLYTYPDSYKRYFPLWYLLWLLIMLCFDYYIRLTQIKERKVEQTLQHDLSKALEKAEHHIVEGLSTIVSVIDEKDEYTKLHSERVARYTQLIAKAYGITDTKELERMYQIALLHDIGKIAIPDAILKKSQSLTDEEFTIMKTHTFLGEKILQNLTFLPDAPSGAIYHHEKPDGTGYPKGLTGADIPLIARIISVADSLDAMNSSRVYRDNCSKEFILDEFRKNSGHQFDADVVTVVCRLIEDGTIETT